MGLQIRRSQHLGAERILVYLRLDDGTTLLVLSVYGIRSVSGRYYFSSTILRVRIFPSAARVRRVILIVGWIHYSHRLSVVVHHGVCTHAHESIHILLPSARYLCPNCNIDTLLSQLCLYHRNFYDTFPQVNSLPQPRGFVVGMIR